MSDRSPFGRLPGDTTEEKLRLNHIVTPEGCWRWIGAHRPKGYGTLVIAGRTLAVHRLAHELWVGPIPDGYEVDHVAARGCVHRDCINPDHLEAVTPQENLARRVAVNNQNSRKTHCKRGHEFTPENTRTMRDGGRVCRECDRRKSAERRRSDG